MFVDSHCHLHEVIFDSDRKEVIQRANAVGITRFFCDASTELDWTLIEKLYTQYGSTIIRPGFGIHPWYANSTTSGWQDRLITQLNKYPDAVVAEIGLDWVKKDMVSFEIQKDVFLRQMQIAKQLNRDVTVHCVRAWDKMLEFLKSFGSFESAITFHSFCGSVSNIDWLLLRYNAFFSFNVRQIRENQKTDLQTLQYLQQKHPQRIRYESDAPYMSLERGKRNEPCVIGQALAISGSSGKLVSE